jgi:hypothetical protein
MGLAVGPNGNRAIISLRRPYWWGIAIGTTVLAALIGVGALIAANASLTAVIVIVALSFLLYVVIPRAAVIMIFVAPIATAQVSPLGALFVLVTWLIIFAVRQKSVLHPFVLFGLPISLYIIIGGANISTYRGTVSGSTITFILLHVLTLFLGVAIIGGVKRQVLQSSTGFNVKPEWLLIGVLPGLVGVLLVVHSAGLAIIHPQTRAEIHGLSLLLAESLEAGLLLYACHAFSQPSRRSRDVIVICLILTGLAMPGYRGWPVIGLILVAICGIYFRRIRVTIRGILLLTALITLIIAGGEFIRRDTAAGKSPGSELSTQELAVQYHAQSVPPGLLELHFAFRETVGLTQILIHDRQEGRRVHSSLLLGDFKTILPGKQISGGVLLNQVVGIQGPLGLTAGAVGISYMDLGSLSLALFFAVGALLGVAWRFAAKDPRWAMFYFLVVLYAIQWFHRGVPKPSYIVVPFFFLWLATLAKVPSLAKPLHMHGARVGRLVE